MKQAIAGVAPPELGEVTVMTVWPSIAATGIGRMIGTLCGIPWPFPPFNIGKLFAVALIPVALKVYLLRYAMPLITWVLTFGMAPANSFCLRYRLTNRRLVVQKGLLPIDDRAVSLDGFDAIEVQTLSGQEWYPAGELIFRKGPVEVFRLSGVSRPEAFRQVCLKTRQAYVSVKQAMS